MKKFTIIAMLVSASFAATSYAQHVPPEGPKGGPAYHMDSLNLTPEQKAKMDAIRDEMRKQNDASHKARQAEMKALLNSPTFDEAKAKAMISKGNDERALRRLKQHYDMYQVLTPEQRQKYMESMNNMHNNGRHAKGMHNGNKPNGKGHGGNNHGRGVGHQPN